MQRLSVAVTALIAAAIAVVPDTALFSARAIGNRAPVFDLLAGALALPVFAFRPGRFQTDRTSGHPSIEGCPCPSVDCPVDVRQCPECPENSDEADFSSIFRLLRARR